jgi:hypothetical protein
VYIARAIQAFVKDGNTLIKISYFLSKFDYDSILFKVSLTMIPYFLSKFDLLSVYQFYWNITAYFELNKITLIMKPTLCYLVRIPKQWDNNSFGLREHAE